MTEHAPKWCDFELLNAIPIAQAHWDTSMAFAKQFLTLRWLVPMRDPLEWHPETWAQIQEFEHQFSSTGNRLLRSCFLLTLPMALRGMASTTLSTLGI